MLLRLFDGRFTNYRQGIYIYIYKVCIKWSFLEKIKVELQNDVVLESELDGRTKLEIELAQG